MYQVTATLEGIAPILFNRLYSLEQLEGGDGSKHASLWSEEEHQAEAIKKLYRDDNGIYVPATAVKKCLLNGAKMANLKIGRKGAVQYLQATCFGSTQNFYFTDGSGNIHEPAGVDKQPGRRPPRTGGRIIIYRPYLDIGWLLPIAFTVVDDRQDERQVETAIHEAGLLVGLLDQRPDYGRFLVHDFARREYAP